MPCQDDNDEVCYDGVRGKVAPWYDRTSNVIFEVPRGHSMKPEGFWELVEPHSPMERVEAFSRDPRDGWDVWGDQVQSTVDLSTLFSKK